MLSVRRWLCLSNCTWANHSFLVLFLLVFSAVQFCTPLDPFIPFSVWGHCLAAPRLTRGHRVRPMGTEEALAGSLKIAPCTALLWSTRSRFGEP